MSDLKNHTTTELISELANRRYITFVPTPITKNRVEVVVEDCLHEFTKTFPNGKPYITNCTYDEFHNNCKGVLVIENDT